MLPAELAMLLLGTVLAFSSVQALAPYGAPGQGRPGVARADGLVAWGNGHLEVARSPFEAGAELILSGTWLGEHNGGVWGRCSWMTPGGEEWSVVGEAVLGPDGELEGVTVWGETEATCGIKIEKATQETHAGNWFVLTSPGDNEKLNISLSLDTRDEISDGLRLPKDFDPLRYDVGLIPQLDDSAPTSQQRFRGWSNMTLLAVETQSWLVFHADQLPFDDLHLYDNDMTELSFDVLRMDFQRTLVSVHNANGDFVEGQTYNMNVVFTADLTRGSYFNYGFYHRPCSDDTTVHCWYTQFESTTTRNAFPCLDEPGLKANFTMSIGRSKEYTSLSNNALERTIPDLDPAWTGGLEDWELDVYFMTVEMSPYLVAASVHQYTGLQSETAPWHTVWAPKFEVDAGRADYAAAVGPEIMLKYQEYFGVMYPLAKMDLVYEPHKGGAMENWGHVNFCERCLLTDDSQDADSKFQTLSIIAHELAHQWFGNIVTCDWWEQTWLNEGFATYVSYIGSQYIEPEWNSWARMYVKEMQRVMHGDEDTRVHWAMTDEVTTRGDVDRKFGMFTYQKGGSVIRMMEQMFGLDTLTKGLSLYLADRSFKSSTEDDLFFHIEVAALEDGSWPQASGPQGSLGETMKTWTNQAGLPLVHASQQCSATGCQLVLSQEWLVMTGQQTDEERRWDVPVTWYSISLPQQQTARPDLPQAWIPASADSVTVEAPELSEGSAFLVNLDGFGYYRVNYDLENWAAVAELLRTDRDSISPMGRAQLICDVLALQQTGHVSTETVADILSYIPQETDYAPLLAHERCSLYVKGDYRDAQEDLMRI